MPQPAKRDARSRLIAAAMDLFGRRGLDGVSIREIAAKARVNIAGIAYHFGGKKQLYLACAEHIAQTIQAVIAARRATADATAPPVRQIMDTIEGMARYMLATPEAASFARFVMREQMDPSPAFDVLYGGVMEPLHERFCQLWAEATGAPAQSEATKLKVFTLLGQVFIFRMARAGVLKRLGWREIGAEEIEAVLANARETLEALLTREKAKVRS